jgi:hypothetical protein
VQGRGNTSLLLRSLLGGLGLGSLVLGTQVSFLCSRLSVGSERLELLLLGGDGSGLLGSVAGRKGGKRSGDVGGEVLALAISVCESLTRDDGRSKVGSKEDGRCLYSQ